MNTPKIDWYGNDILRTLKPSVEEVIPDPEPVAQSIPEYPATLEQADEVTSVETKADMKEESFEEEDEKDDGE